MNPQPPFRDQYTPPSYGHPPYPSSHPQQGPRPNFRINILFATTAFAADLMTGTLDFVSMGALFAFSLFVAAILFVAGVFIQHHDGDPWTLAASKSACVALLLAIPGPVASVATIAWGIGSSMKGPHDPDNKPN